MKGMLLCIAIFLYIGVVCFVANVILIQIIIKHCLPDMQTSSNKDTFNINITFCSSPTTTSQWKNMLLSWPFLPRIQRLSIEALLWHRSYHHYYRKQYWAFYSLHQIRWKLAHLQWRMLGHVSEQEMKLPSFLNCWIPLCGLNPCIPIPQLVMLVFFQPSKTHP